jgi:hypothetical protein
MHIATESQLSYFKQRWEHTLANSVEALDPLLVPALTALSKYPGVAPVWSCQGHLEKRKGNKCSGYIMFATDNRELFDNLLEALFNVSCDTDKLSNYPHLWRLSHTFRKHQGLPEEDQWWKALILSWNIPFGTTPEDWIAVLEKAIEQIKSH